MTLNQRISLYFLGLLVLTIIATACGRVDVSDSKHEIGGEATVRVEIDVPLCSKLPEDEQADCIREIIAAANAGNTGATTKTPPAGIHD